MPREYYKRYANTLWAVRMRYANTLCEYAMGRASTVCDTRIGYTLWAIACRVAFSATILLLFYFAIASTSRKTQTQLQKIRKRSSTAFRKLMCVRTQHSSVEAFHFFGRNLPILGRNLPICRRSLRFAAQAVPQKNVPNVSVIFFFWCVPYKMFASNIWYSMWQYMHLFTQLVLSCIGPSPACSAGICSTLSWKASCSCGSPTDRTCYSDNQTAGHQVGATEVLQFVLDMYIAVPISCNVWSHIDMGVIFTHAVRTSVPVWWYKNCWVYTIGLLQLGSVTWQCGEKIYLPLYSNYTARSTLILLIILFRFSHLRNYCSGTFTISSNKYYK